MSSQSFLKDHLVKWPFSVAIWSGKKNSTFCIFLTLTLFYMGGNNVPPWSIIAWQSSMDALNWLIFHDFVPFNIRKVLGRSFLNFFLKISKIFASTNFSKIDPKGGPFYTKIKKIKKGIFFAANHIFST